MQKFERSMTGVGLYIENEGNRLDKFPRIGEDAARILYGKPERIEHSAILLFY
jgi:hypothetical protein